MRAAESVSWRGIILGRVCVLSHVRLCDRQAPLSMEFSRPEYWSGLPLPTPGDLPDPGSEPASRASSAVTGGFCTTAPSGKPLL